MKKGDKVRVINNESGHFFNIGQIVVIEEIQEYFYEDEDYICTDEDTKESCYLYGSDIELISVL